MPCLFHNIFFHFASQVEEKEDNKELNAESKDVVEAKPSSAGDTKVRENKNKGKLKDSLGSIGNFYSSTANNLKNSVNNVPDYEKIKSSVRSYKNIDK